MKTCRILIAKSAEDDLQELLDWYRAEGVPHVGERLAREILERIEALARFPEMGRMVPEVGVESLREIIFRPFRIVYMIKASSSEILIIRIWRSERRLRLPDMNGI